MSWVLKISAKIFFVCKVARVDFIAEFSIIATAGMMI